MARFYFHVASKDEFVTDDEGMEFPTLGACHEYAVRIIRECFPFVRHDRGRWWVEVANARGRTLLVVLYPRHIDFGLRSRHHVRHADMTKACNISQLLETLVRPQRVGYEMESEDGSHRARDAATSFGAAGPATRTAPTQNIITQI